MNTDNNIRPIFSVIIVNFNAGDRLARCLRHLSVQSETRFDITVVDNASSDNSITLAEETGVSFKLMALDRNTGFAAANNLAAREARASWLAFVNPDVYAAPDWLESIEAAISRYPGVDAFGSTQLNAADPSVLDGAGDVFHAFGVPYRGHHGWPVSTLPPEGACFAPCAAAAVYRREAFITLGGFEEKFFCYCEDLDLGFRLRLAGGKAIQLRDARVEHEGSGITGRRSDFTIYHGHRNRIWTYLRNMPAVLLVLLFPFHVIVNAAFLVWFLVKGGAKPYAKAMIDGYGRARLVMADRKKIQRTRKATLGEVARALTWSPIKAVRRQADIRPFKHD